MPGPDILFVINQSLEDKKSSLLVAFGLCSGLIIHTLVLALGLSAIIEQNDNVIIVLQILWICLSILFGFFKNLKR